MLTLSRLRVEPVGGEEGVRAGARRPGSGRVFLCPVARLCVAGRVRAWFALVVFIKHDVAGALCVCIFKLSELLKPEKLSV